MNGALKAFSTWILYGFLFLAAAAAMLLGKVDTVLVETLRVQTANVIRPVLDTMSRPFDTAADSASRISDLIALARGNAALRHERNELIQWQGVAERLAEENAVLRRLLNAVPDPQARYVAARVIADPGGAFSRSILLSAGANNGVQPGQIVVSGEGLVGRVAGVADRVARVVLITDINSRVPVTVGNSYSRAILTGTNTDLPVLLHVDGEATVAVGDRVVTSGITGAFPPGLPIGVVVSINPGHVTVKPFFERSRLEFLRVLDHGYRGLGLNVAAAAPEPR